MQEPRLCSGLPLYLCRKPPHGRKRSVTGQQLTVALKAISPHVTLVAAGLALLALAESEEAIAGAIAAILKPHPHAANATGVHARLPLHLLCGNKSITAGQLTEALKVWT